MTVDAGLVLEPLENPPIVEAVCGFHFEPLGQLDAMAIGEFRALLREQFPSHQLQPPLYDTPLPFLPLGELRLVMTSKDEERVVQVQRDRMYFNWRRVNDGVYPRFSDHDGRPGVCSMAIDAFERFQAFCELHLKQRPTVRRCELSKINHLVAGEHWREADDLADLLPSLRAWVYLGSTPSLNFQCSLQSAHEDGQASITVHSAVRWKLGGVAQPVVVADLRFHAQTRPEEPLMKCFERANTTLNTLFASLVPTDQRHRFGRKN